MRSPKDTGRRVHVGRVLGTVTASCVLAAGFLAAPVAGLPWNAGTFQSLAADQHTPDVGPGSRVGEGVSVGVVGASTSTGPTTLQEVLGVLERAELAGKDAGRTVTPRVEQAAAELGMLLSTYLAQQAASAPDRPFATADAEVPAPVLPAPETTTPAPTSPVPTSPDDAPPATVDEPGTVAVSREVALDPADPEPADPDPAPTTQQPATDQPDADQPESTHDGDAVTFDDVVVAATRLATLLDPATTTLEAGILPAGADGTVAARATLTKGLLAVVDRYGATTAGYANGRIPTSVLCPLDFAPGHMLRCDAAEQLSALSKEYEKEFGVPIPMTDSYRSLDLQIRVKAIKGWLAATPGTSNHGWGLAVDLGYPISTFTSAEHAWMRVHAPDYGWDNPSWARSTGSKPEPWHFEFFAAGPIPDRAWDAADVAGGGGTTDRAEQAGKGAHDTTGGSQATGGKDGTAKGKASDKASDKGTKDKGTKPSGSPSDGGAKGSGKGGGSSEQPATPAKVAVPDVAGQSLAAAKKTLHALGLEVRTTTRESDKPKGQVLATRDAGTKVRKGTTVTLVVASGPRSQPEPTPERVAVPAVAGQDAGAAEQALRDLGLDVKVVREHSTKRPDGTALRTEPGSGATVDVDSSVTLVVSSGPEQVTVPDVTGWTVADARAKLEGLGFVVETSGDVEDDDLVVETQGAGDTVDKGSTVRLTGGAAEPVPDVAGMTVAAAREELEALGFEVVTEDGVEDDAVVSETDVAAGRSARLGSTVTLVVETGTSTGKDE
ncbi:PASTA domain-containing protein [Isoptericola sp. F-RaC21]|uniref:PASTA domain-containing protein n=1 Tax=Isoptericola sp. F-RaC21 TaxID=3141452 RepID=UPI00315C2654